MPSKPPSPRGPPILGNTIGYASDRFGFVRDARKACGDVFIADLLGLGEVCYLTHPNHFERVLDTDRAAFGKSDLLRFALGDGLLSVDGDRWERQRTVLEEFFYPERIRSYAEEMVTLTERRIDRWSEGETRSLLEEMTALALEIIFSTLFDRQLSPDVDEALRRAAADLNGYFTPTSLVLPRWVPTPSRRRFRRADDTLRRELRRLLDERTAAGERGDDLLSTLGSLSENDDVTMSKETIIDQLVTVLFAGHETTALAMTYAFYELGTNPAIRDRVHRELDTVLDGDRPSAADVSELAAIERVLTEVLRLYPPAHTIPRVTTRDVDIGGYRLPEGTQTHLALHSVHRDERFYDEPLAFRPERWHDRSPESVEYAYVPFGAGPRTCIGRRFALLEATLVLATVSQRYWLNPEEPLELAPLMSTQPAGDVPVTIQART